MKLKASCAFSNISIILICSTASVIITLFNYYFNLSCSQIKPILINLLFIYFEERSYPSPVICAWQPDMKIKELSLLHFNCLNEYA